MTLRVLVVGRGAVGSFLGGTLAAGGADVTLLGRPGQAQADGSSGDEHGELRIHGPHGSRTVPVRRLDDLADAPTPDLAILAVKTFDLGTALTRIAHWPDVPVLTIQNGVGAEEIAIETRRSALMAGSLTSAVEPMPDGVRLLRTGGLGIAQVRDDADGRAAALSPMLVAAVLAGGLPVRVYPDPVAMKWSKLLANLVANATGALLDMEPGDIYADPLTYAIERRQLREAVAVMDAIGVRPVDLPGASVRLLLRGLALPAAIGRPVVARAIAGARGGKSPSLRLHLLAGRGAPTEVRWLNGAVARVGREHGIEVPVNTRLEALVDEAAADPVRWSWFRERPDRLRDALGAASGRG